MLRIFQQNQNLYNLRGIDNSAPDTLCVGYAPERRYLERRLQEIEKEMVWMCVEFGGRQTTKGAGSK